MREGAKRKRCLEVLVATAEYEMSEYLRGYFAFGGNGSGELFVFELQANNADRQVFMVPAIGMAQSDLRPLATSFVEFQSQWERPRREGGPTTGLHDELISLQSFC